MKNKTLFENMCAACKIANSGFCQENTIEKCKLERFDYLGRLEKMKHNKEHEEMHLCSDCVYRSGCHSTIFGECWSCSAKGDCNLEVEDNDWNDEEEGFCGLCYSFTYGVPFDWYVG